MIFVNFRHFLMIFVNFSKFHEYSEYSSWSVQYMADSFVIQGCQKQCLLVSKTAVLANIDILQLLFGCCTSIVQNGVKSCFLQWKFESLLLRGPENVIFMLFLIVLN